MPILAFKMPSRISSRPRAVKGRTGRRRSDPPRRRTFRPQNYSTRPPVKAWTPPVPEPLPPAPLLSPVKLLGIGALALLQHLAAQLWGRNNNPQRVVYDQLPIAEFVGYGNYNGAAVNYTIISDRYSCSGNLYEKGWINNNPAGISATGVWGFKYKITSGVRESICYLPESSWTLGKVWWVETSVMKTQYGPWEHHGGWQEDFGTYWNGVWKGKHTYLPYIKSLTRNGVPLEIPTVDSPEPRGLPKPGPVGRMPSGFVMPAFPFPIGRPDPFAPLEPDPVETPVTAPVVPVVVVRNPVRPALVPQNPVQVQDGVVVRPAPLPVTVTDPDWIFPIPGKPGLPGNGPQPNLPEMAKELGRIERKMEALLNPKGEGNPAPDWLDQFDDLRDNLDWIFDLLGSIAAGGEYKLREACDPDGDGVLVERVVPYSGALGPLGVISNKIDALAELMQAAKDLRQPVCPPAKSTGQLVSIHFASLLTPPGDNHKLLKLFRYRDQSGAELVVHHDHWKDFTWTSGPVLVKSTGMPWGKPQVWAVSAEEGKRVLAHAAAVAGVNLADQRHKWDIRTVTAPRYGRSEVLEVKRLNLDLRAITKRPGPDGPIWVVAD